MSALSAVSIALSLAVASAAWAEEPDVRDVLRKVDSATKAVKAVSYEAELLRVAKDGASTSRGRAAVVLEKINPDELDFKVHVRSLPGEGTGKAADSLIFAADGKSAMKIDHGAKTFTKADHDESRGLAGSLAAFVMTEYVHATPFSDEINARSARFEPEQKVGGVDCYVIYVEYGRDGAGDARWYFAKSDLLPRRVDRIGPNGSSTMVLSNVNPKPQIDRETFALKAPEGYQERQPDRPPPPPELLAPGKEAPGFTLQTPSGESVSLASARGKVVLLDFWAVWCLPCRAAMPHVQKLHEKFKDKGLVVLGVNTWEEAENDPAAYMKEHGYSYGLLLKGDETAKAYNVSGIPTFYVIDREGRITYAASGAGEQAEKALDEAIEAALKARPGS